MPIRFHLDEHMAHAIATGLRRRGVDVTTPGDVGLLGASDEEHLAYALSEGRMVVTHDRDFLGLDKAGHPHAGIAYCDHGRRSKGQIVNQLVALSESHVSEETAGRILYM